VKKPYRVRRTVDRSVRYFEASYLAKRLLHDNDVDDNDVADVTRASSMTSRAVQRQTSTTRFPEHRRSASIRSATRLKFDSVINSDDVDDVTNIKR